MGDTLKLTLDTGLIDVTLEDMKGNELGSFSFNPTDIDIVNRYQECIKMLEGVEMPKEPSFEDVEAVSSRIKEAFDYLLNADVRDGIFGKLNPLTSVANGDFYFEKVLEQIAAVIEKELDQRVEQKRAKINKIVNKYK